MARTERMSCDLCGKDTTKIVAKLTLIPTRPGINLTHSNYTAHADVGECCSESVLKLAKWQKRLNKSQYIQKRKMNKRKPTAAA